jgi:hypothetical protein
MPRFLLDDDWHELVAQGSPEQQQAAQCAQQLLTALYQQPEQRSWDEVLQGFEKWELLGVGDHAAQVLLPPHLDREDPKLASSLARVLDVPSAAVCVLLADDLDLSDCSSSLGAQR